MNELKIEMQQRDDLIELHKYLLSELDDSIDLQEINEISPGFNREPLLIALVVALGGPVVTKQIVGLIKEWLRLRHKEKMAKLSILSMDGKREVTLEELEGL